MTKYARIVDNKIWETFVPHSGATIEECFTPELVAQFISCPDEVDQTWSYVNGEFIAPPVQPEPLIITEDGQIVE